AAEGEIDGAGEHVGEQRARIGNHLHFDLVDLWSAQHVVGERVQQNVAPRDPFVQLEGAAADELQVPVGRVGESRLVLTVGRLQDVAGHRLGEGAGADTKHAVGRDVGTLPAGDHRARVQRFDAVD